MELETARLSVRNVGLSFASGATNMEVLRGFSLEVHQGEFVSIIGPSGCGKSSLLKIVAGLIAPTEGAVFIDGQPINGCDPRVGMVFQEYALFPWLTLRDNVEFGLKMRGVPATRRREEAAKFIDLVQLRGFEGHYPHQLSGGQRQRAAIARALVVGPEILLMDEPLAALDAQTRITLQEEVERIVAITRMTVLFVTHSVEEAVYLSDRIVVSTARPGQIKEVVPVDLPRPRDRTSPSFAAIEARALRSVREEILRAGDHGGQQAL